MKPAALIILLISLIAATGCGRKGPALDGGVQFSAVLVSEEDGSRTENKISFTSGKQRLDMMPPSTGTVIIRMDKGVIWTLMPPLRLYLETPLAPQAKNPLTYNPDSVTKWEKVGDEVVDGHPAVKERLTFKNKDGAEMEIYRWFATDIKWPVKAQAINGKWTLSLKGVAPGKQDPSVFEIPRGYRSLVGRTRPAMHQR